MPLLRGKGRRTRRLSSYLRRRARERPERRPEMDCRNFPRLFRRHAIVFTDTADFTLRAARDGILHFLMVFDAITELSRKVVERAGGELVKAEGDSLLILYPDANAACSGVLELEQAIQAHNEGRPDNEQVHFSYGIGYGDLLDTDGDVFGLEVNLASKLGEDLAEPGEALLTPSAAAALDAERLRRVVPYRVVTFGRQAIPVSRFKLRGSVRRARAVRRSSA